MHIIIYAWVCILLHNLQKALFTHVISFNLKYNNNIQPSSSSWRKELRTLHATSLEKEELGKKSNEKVYFDICKGP